MLVQLLSARYFLHLGHNCPKLAESCFKLGEGNHSAVVVEVFTSLHVALARLSVWAGTADRPTSASVSNRRMHDQLLFDSKNLNMATSFEAACFFECVGTGMLPTVQSPYETNYWWSTTLATGVHTGVSGPCGRFNSKVLTVPVSGCVQMRCALASRVMVERLASQCFYGCSLCLHGVRTPRN